MNEETNHEAADNPPAEMTEADQIMAFKTELEALVDRYASEFDLAPETLIGCMKCQESLMLAEMTMCYIATYAIDEDEEDEEDTEGERWKDDE